MLHTLPRGMSRRKRIRPNGVFRLAEVSLTVMIRVPVLKAAEVIYNRHYSALSGPSILLPTQSATHHLHVANRTKHLPGDEHHVRFWCIEAGSQNTVIAHHSDITALEPVEKIAARDGRRVPTDGGRRNAGEV